MTFFYDLNKKLDSIREKPEVTHKQLNERAMADESALQAYLGKKKYGEEGMKALQKAGREGASKEKMDHIRDQHDKMDEGGTGDYSAKKARAGKDIGKPGKAFSKIAADAGKRYGSKAAGERVAGAVLNKLRHPTEEGVMDTVKSVGKRVAGSVNKLVGHGSDEDMIKDLQRKSGAPVTGKKPKNFADKIADAKKEVDEMLGDVAAEAIKTALSPKQKKIDMNKNGKLDANDFAMLRKGAKPEMDEANAFDYKSPRDDKPKVGSIERGHKHDIEHTATGRKVTRRVDDQGHSVGADDDTDTQQGPRGRGRPKGTKGAIGAKGPSGKSKLITKEGDVSTGHLQQMYNQLVTLKSHVQDPDGQASLKELISMVKHYMNQGSEQELDEKAVSKAQQKFMGMAHAMQKGEKIPGASKELKKVAKTMKKGDVEDFAKTKHKGLPEKAPKKKKEEEVEESSTTSGSVAPSTASTGSKGGVYGKGIYDSMNFELEQMIAESMSVNMSDSTEGGKSLTITATDEDALKLGMMLKNAGLGGDSHGDEMHSHGEEPCPTCGMEDCGCGDVQEAVDENAPDWPTNTETSDDALQYAGGLNKPKTDVAGDGQTTIPNTAVHTQDEDALRRMMEMAGIAQAELEPWKETMKEEAEEELDESKECPTCHKAPCACDESMDEDFLESIQRMREIAGIKEAKKDVEEEKTEEGNLFTGNLAKARADGKKQADLDGDGDLEKVRESIFTLTNQWRAYRG